MEDHSMIQSNPQTFTLFPLLPPELRLTVWKSTFTPRIIELRTKFHPLPNNTKGIRFTSFCPPPITLSINHESRNEALRHYQLAFESKDYYPNTSPQIYVNFSLDTIYLDSQTFDLISCPHRPLSYLDPMNPILRFLEATTKSNSNLIKSLAIDEKIWLSNPNTNATHLSSERHFILSENAKAIRSFKNLEELIIVHHGVNISVPCAYSYLKRYECHKAYIFDMNLRWSSSLPLSECLNQQLSLSTPPSSSSSNHIPFPPNSPQFNNTPNPSTFIRYLDKPLWTPTKKSYSAHLHNDRTLRTLGRASISKRDFESRYNETGKMPIYGQDLERLERGLLGFFELEGGDGRNEMTVDFMDGVVRGCVFEDRLALEMERDRYMDIEEDMSEKEWVLPAVRSVGLIRDGREC